METVYIETTILSYLVSRPSRDIIVAGRQQLTRDWWEFSRERFECVVSQIVIDEISACDPDHAEMRLQRSSSLSALAINEACIDMANAIITRGLLPQQEARDALHIAVATIWQTDYLLTWNCKHIANAHILKHLRLFLQSLGHEIPHVCTPEEL
jgi:hypothetical protein